jgi:RNA polymerase sigma-70 factor (ECF subfamily)
MLATAKHFFQNEHDAADAVQDAFISALKAIKTFKGESQLGTWLHRIVVNCCLMRRRSHDRHPTVAIESLLPQFDGTGHHVYTVKSFGSSAYEKVTREETRQQVRQCIDRLPAPYREIIVLRDIEDFDTQTTAQMLSVSTSVVKTRLHRARQALCTLLKTCFTHVA